MTPESLIGLWRRDRIEFSDGRVDSTTQVFWGQTGSLYVDIRIPVGAAKVAPKQLLEEYAADERAALAEQKGFAGHIRLTGNQCEWGRSLDYQPETGRPDKAEIELVGDTLIERGDAGSVLGSSYREIFHRISPGTHACLAAQLVKSTGSWERRFAQQGCLLVVLDTWFLFAQPRTTTLPAASNLAQLVSMASPAQAVAYLDCEYSLGRVSNDGAAWTIELSTLPFRRGHRLFPAAKSAQHEKNHDLTVAFSHGALTWRVAENSLTPTALMELFSCT